MAAQRARAEGPGLAPTLTFQISKIPSPHANSGASQVASSELLARFIFTILDRLSLLQWLWL
jgi:hypothetical protein